MASIQFIVLGIPIAQPRQRHRIIKAKATGKEFVSNYTPADSPVNSFKASARSAAHAEYEGAPLEGPLKLQVRFVMPRPQAMMWKSRPTPRVHHTKKPDSDNLLKALKDALTGVIWRDDCQVCDTRMIKVTASGDEQPHTEVQIDQLEEL